MLLGFADVIFRRERSDDRKYVCASQANRSQEKTKPCDVCQVRTFPLLSAVLCCESCVTDDDDDDVDDNAADNVRANYLFLEQERETERESELTTKFKRKIISSNSDR